MIEFKAECGHTVRARDDDVGGVVRCSYCGRDAAVPDAREDDLEFLFRDSDVRGEATPPSKRKRRRRRPPKRARTDGEVNPFGVILKMCYAAGLICIVIILGNKFVLPLFEEGGISNRAVRTSPADDAAEAAERARRKTRHSAGLSGVDTLGLYVGSTPPRASVYFIEEEKAPTLGRIAGVPDAKEASANGGSIRLPDGNYAVEVVLPTHHPTLNNPSLPYYERYLALRRAIEGASDAERSRLLDEFFLPDEALRVFVDQTDELFYIVRQYRNVEVRNGRSNGVRALMLPKIRAVNQDSFSIAPLVEHYLPKSKSYEFNDGHVRSELRFYGVPVEDQQILVDALARVGVMPYVTPDGRTRLFKVGIHDGMCTGKVIREAGE